MNDQTPPSRTCRGFTLIELLVVISIISIMVGLTFPVLSAMQSGSRVSAATNTVSVAVDAARSLAQTENNFAIGVLPGGATGTYDGTAVIFTPSGECRLVVNDQTAISSSGGSPSLEVGFVSSRNGYKDIEGRDYIALPKGAGVAGMIRSGDSSDIFDLRFLPPPFAVAFDENGRLIARAFSATAGTIDGSVYYDADGDTFYRTATTGNGARPSPYDPDVWDAGQNNVPTVGDIADPKDRLRYELPFERIETVVAIVIYDKQTFEETVPNGWNGTTAAINTYMTQDNDDLAKVMFFSPSTGTIIRN